MHQRFWAACVLGLSQIPAVLAVDTPTCVPACEGQVRAKFSDLKCTDANDAPCLCAAPGFLEGIKQCSQPTCGATEAQVASYLDGAFCVAFPIGEASKSASKSAAPAASSSSVAPASTSGTKSAESTSVAALTTSSATSSSTTSQAATEKTASSSSSMASSTTESSQTTQDTSTTTDLVASSKASSTALGDKDSQNDKHNDGLSHTAVIGIAVGCAAAGVAIIGIVACLLLRRRRSSQARSGRPAPQISKPIVGAGRTAVSPDPGSYEKYGNDDIEMRTNRYEDMPPQQTPRTMV